MYFDFDFQHFDTPATPNPSQINKIHWRNSTETMSVSAAEPKNPEISFICIHCGNHVRELYKKYSSSVIKMRNCEHCHEIADKYIEFEPIIIAIDLVLLSRPAYRHVLYNTSFRIHWKLNLVILLLDAYIVWSSKSHLFSSLDGNFTKEKLFYFCFVLSLIGMFCRADPSKAKR